MEFRNPEYTADGRIKCEINHKAFGWIPFTASPDDAPSAALFAEIVEAGGIAAYAAPTPPSPTAADVNAERDRRIIEGATFTISGYGDVRSLGRDIDKTNLQALGFAASLRIAAGDVTTITPFRDADDVVHDLTPPQVLELWSQASTYVSSVFQASWAIKDDPGGIPVDYTADAHWT